MSQQRVDQIAAALEKAEAKVAANPGHDKMERWEKRIEEYRQSLVTFALYGQETPPSSAKKGAEIDVPLGRFGLSKG